MKFVYFGYDFMLGAVQALLDDGHELLGIFSFDCDNVFNFNMAAKNLADRLSIPFSIQRPIPLDIQVFISQGATCFLSAGYPFKIPPIDENLAYGINLHPSLLPMGRGIMPTPTILMHHPEAAGLSLHKLTPQFDTGDILYQRALTLSADDDVETYSARIAMMAPDIFCNVFKNLPSFWSQSIPQTPSKASTFPMPTDAMRMLDWRNPVEMIKKTGKAFGRFGCLARFDGRLWAVYNFSIWQENHNYKTGEIVCILSREIIIAARDGFVCLKDYQELKPPPPSS
jgi:methionyl-tRNA formyltransferase